MVPQHAKTSGELAVSETTLAERRAELDSEYNDIQKHYTRQLIRVKVNHSDAPLPSYSFSYNNYQTADFAIQDLDKYGKALDQYMLLRTYCDKEAC